MVRRFALTVALLAAAVVAVVDDARAESEAPPAVIVIVHPLVPSEGLTYAELRDLVLGKRRFWAKDSRVELFVAGVPSVERRWWVEVLSGMTEVQFRQYWIGEVFRGRATSAPRAVPDRRTSLALVGVVPGALAIVQDGPLPPTVRALRVDGLLPDSPAYPLR